MNIGSIEYGIRDLQWVMQDLIKEICAIWFVITMRADGAPELEEVSCRAIRSPGFRVTRNFAMTSQNVTKQCCIASDVTEKKNIIAALEHRRVCQDNPRPLGSLCLVDDAGHQRLLSSRCVFSKQNWECCNSRFSRYCWKRTHLPARSTPPFHQPDSP